MAQKMSRGLVALSSAAILSVYGAGYVLSQPTATMAAPSDTAVSNTAASPVAPANPPDTEASPISTATAASTAAPPSVSAPASTASSTAQPANGFKDGTYAGSGTSRHGGVNVSVTIQNGKIISAGITSVSTRYSQNVISGLPSQVIGAQSPNINLVSGATDSSDASVQAVQQALAKATTTSVGATTSGVQVTSPSGVIYKG
jgi:uncharacterized protein with FMN-binding domain